jgi:hypothetical protein
MEVRANAYDAIEDIAAYLKEQNISGAGFTSLTLLKIKQFEDNPDTVIPSPSLSAPDGQPIESGYDWLDADCDWK